MTTPSDDTTPEILDPVELAAMTELFRGKRKLAVPLTDGEWWQHSEDAAAKFAQYEHLKEVEDANRKAFNSEHKARVAEHARVNKLVNDKTEDRDVEVITYGDIASNERITVRVDTYEAVERRALDANETARLQQGDMFNGDGDGEGTDDPDDQVDPAEDPATNEADDNDGDGDGAGE